MSTELVGEGGQQSEVLRRASNDTVTMVFYEPVHRKNILKCTLFTYKVFVIIVHIEFLGAT